MAQKVEEAHKFAHKCDEKHAFAVSKTVKTRIRNTPSKSLKAHKGAHKCDEKVTFAVSKTVKISISNAPSRSLKVHKFETKKLYRKFITASKKQKRSAKMQTIICISRILPH